MSNSFAKNLKILICDDMEAIVEIYVDFLKELGIQEENIDITNNGKVCAEKLSSKKYDLLIADIDVQELNGFEMLELKKMSQNKNTPTIVVTMKKSKEDVNKSISLGVSKYIIKPFDAMIFSKYAKALLKI